jgi:rod shape-determining protein MreD
MRRNLAWAAVIITAALLQTTWLDEISVSGARPDLMAIIVVYFALASGSERAMATGVLGGLFQDMASNYVLGHHVLSLVTVGYVVGRVSRRLVTDHPGVKAALVFCASLVNGVLVTLVLFVQNPDTAAVSTVVSRTVPTAFYTALVTPLVFFVLDWLAGLGGRQESYAQ